MRILELLKQRLISNALTHLYRDAAKRPLTIDFDPGAEKLVCVSDLHRGKRDGADDFRRTERVYNAALAWYHSEGYRLAILGDAEDLWECSPKQILGCTDQAATVGYARSLALEKRFNQNAQRYLRVYGNHDRLWASKRARKWLRPHLGDVDVRGAFAIRVCGQCDDLGPDPPMIMLTHGDAGTLDSAVFAPVSRVFVHFWAFCQERIGALTGVPADDWELREKQDRWLYQWAEQQQPGVLLITGHTHRPVFATRTAPPEHTQEGLTEDAKAKIRDHEPANDDPKLEFIAAEMRRTAMLRAPIQQVRPCYFNTGACCFGDGEMTAIEIADGQIRLMRWGYHPDTPIHPQIRAQMLDRESLRTVLEGIKSGHVKPGWAAHDVTDEVTVIHDDEPVGQPRTRVLSDA